MARATVKAVLAGLAAFAMVLAIYAAVTIRDPMAKRVKVLEARREQLKAGIITSSAKKRREPGSTRIHQTPDGSFYDLMRNGWQVLQRCGMRYVPEVISLALLCLFGWEGVLCT